MPYGEAGAIIAVGFFGIVSAVVSGVGAWCWANAIAGAHRARAFSAQADAAIENTDSVIGQNLRTHEEPPLGMGRRRSVMPSDNDILDLNRAHGRDDDEEYNDTDSNAGLNGQRPTIERSGIYVDAGNET